MNKEIVKKALHSKDKWSIGRLISLFENKQKNLLEERKEVIKYFEKQSNRRATIIGFTGTPGCGKSSLISVLSNQMIADNHSIAVLAIDPSSTLSGGAFLGDRTRVSLDHTQNFFFRSQASELNLGGISPVSFPVIKLLYYLFDFIFIETVGIGQSEVDIKALSDKTFLLLQPLGGDEIQFMKSGIIEVCENFIITKCDFRKESLTTFYKLKNVLGNLAHHDNHTILQSSTKQPESIKNLAQFIEKQRVNLSIEEQDKTLKMKQTYFLEKWIEKEYGLFGLRVFKENTQEILVDSYYEDWQKSFHNMFRLYAHNILQEESHVS